MFQTYTKCQRSTKISTKLSNIFTTKQSYTKYIPKGYQKFRAKPTIYVVPPYGSIKCSLVLDYIKANYKIWYLQDLVFSFLIPPFFFFLFFFFSFFPFLISPYIFFLFFPSLSLHIFFILFFSFLIPQPISLYVN